MPKQNRAEDIDELEGNDAAPRRKAGLLPDENPPDVSEGGDFNEVHRAGTPGGGLAAGGLGGTNYGDGSPTSSDVNLNEAMGTGIHDNLGDEEGNDEPYAGPSGGAVGGTPAGKRARGGNVGRGIDPVPDVGDDNTIGTHPNKPK